MKYNAKQLPNGYWAVFTGQKYWSNTETPNKAEAHTAAEYKSALFLVNEASKILDKSNMGFSYAQDVGHAALTLIDKVTGITKEKDPDFDDMDARAWTC